MARRAGKAASRKARQRNVPRQPKPAPRPAAAEAAEAPDAVIPEAALAPSSSAPAAVIAPRPRRATVVASSTSHGSTLTARERADYHYVERDLRNIGILTALLAILLAAAWFVFSPTGLVG